MTYETFGPFDSLNAARRLTEYAKSFFQKRADSKRGRSSAPREKRSVTAREREDRRTRAGGDGRLTMWKPAGGEEINQAVSGIEWR